MTPTQRAAALRLADLLTSSECRFNDLGKAAALLRELAAEPVQEPECQYAKDVGMPEYRCAGKCQYAAPQQRKPLTDEQIYAAISDQVFWATSKNFIVRVVRDVERAHGIGETP